MFEYIGTYGTTILGMTIAALVLGGALFAGGRPSDIPSVSPKAIAIGVAILLIIVLFLAWRISHVGGMGYVGPTDVG